LFFFAVVGIYLGLFSPTEAAGVSAFVAILIGFGTRRLNWRGLLDSLMETAYATAMLFFIVVGAFMFSRFVVLTQLPTHLLNAVQGAGLSPFAILMSVIVLFILLGTFLEEVSTILITVPVLLPLLMKVGYDGVWFGIMVTVLATVGLISPPTGMTVFVIQAQNPEIPVTKIYRGTLPFLIADFVLIALLIAFPSMALWLPAALKL
jgi:C4-dicarboxylate transporter, DctM subunit